MSEHLAPLATLREKLANIEPSLEAGSISQIQAEHYAVVAISEALTALDPTLRQQGHLRWLDMIQSRIQEIEERTLLRKPIGRGEAMVRYTAVACVEWLPKVGFTQPNSTRHVLRCMNGSRDFLRVNGKRLTAQQLKNWRFGWLRDQHLGGDLGRAGSSIPSSADTIDSLTRALSQSERPPKEAVSQAISDAIRDNLPPESTKPDTIGAEN